MIVDEIRMKIENQLSALTLDEPVKRKKGRPRKEPVENIVQEEKKKRGRKKKLVVEEEVKPKKKRGRKAAVKYFSSSIRKKIPLTTVVEDSNNYILHLDIKDEDIPIHEETQKLEDNPINLMVKKFNDEYTLGDNLKVEDLIKEEDYKEISSQIDLNDLYEQRIESRDNEDKLLISRLEHLKKTDKVVTEDSRNICQDKQRKKGFFELCYDFLHNTEWLERTDVSCWWCCHEFEDVPLGFPLHYVAQTKKFRVRGVFCSFACMVAYKNDLKMHKCEHLVKYLYKRLTGEFPTLLELKPAPPRCALKKFGGELSIDEFRQTTSKSKIYKMVEYPMFVAREYVEEVDIVDLKKINIQVFKDKSELSSEVRLDHKKIEEAKLRLSQYDHITKTSGNTIDKFISIS